MSQQFDFSQILDALQEPFPSHEVEFKPGATNREKTKALALAYVDSRPYIQRLNLVCPDWQDEYQVMMQPDRVVVLCRLTIAGVTRTGDGECLLAGEEGDRAEPNAVTTASAQAFKRACVKFGLGAYLYDLPQVWCDYDAQKRKIINPPQLPEWALPPAERLEKATSRAVEREARLEGRGEMSAEPEPAGEPANLSNPGEFVMPGGKYQGKTLAEIAKTKDGQDYLHWFANLDGKGYQGKGAGEAQRMARAFLAIQAG
ncbi:Rad52/Rad22 family DNA repair protein [Anaerolinea thermophila]|uniref:Rad52/22 double-strand break repair protein n=1 Tax=Anaerolinea thermophila (strain DSM 14523 / JCM 11388 / NBRC 100420 / UNI-1) TaxID=926569 RepID=E8MXR8_ANATU|nr:Rad52/Rad22 family DNA repair protein [Anaerolinea thermophila]BAJ64149.1 hypothetical protein ANT_21230 [Anaerolinea thermophila UNI-1]